jgi:hypothetical protein
MQDIEDQVVAGSDSYQSILAEKFGPTHENNFQRGIRRQKPAVLYHQIFSASLLNKTI